MAAVHLTTIPCEPNTALMAHRKLVCFCKIHPRTNNIVHAGFQGFRAFLCAFMSVSGKCTSRHLFAYGGLRISCKVGNNFAMLCLGAWSNMTIERNISCFGEQKASFPKWKSSLEKLTNFTWKCNSFEYYTVPVYLNLIFVFGLPKYILRKENRFSFSMVFFHISYYFYRC